MNYSQVFFPVANKGIASRENAGCRFDALTRATLGAVLYLKRAA